MILRNYLKGVYLLLAVFLLPSCTDLADKREKELSEELSNSFEKVYKRTNPTLNYSYNEIEQIHNYSNNWDLDGDGKKDKLMFVGSGGAHLHYFLRIALTSQGTISSFPTVESDFPFLPNEKEIAKSDFDPIKTLTFFAVSDFNNDSIDDIFLRIEKSPFLPSKDSLEKKSQPFQYLSISFRNGKPKFRNFEKLNEITIGK